MAQGKLSTPGALKLVSELALELASEGTDDFIKEYSGAIGLNAAQQLAATVAKEAAFVGLSAATSLPGGAAPAGLTGGVSTKGTGTNK